MSVVDGLAGEKSKARLVAVASATSVDAFSTKWLVFVAFDPPYSIAESVQLHHRADLPSRSCNPGIGQRGKVGLAYRLHNQFSLSSRLGCFVCYRASLIHARRAFTIQARSTVVAAKKKKKVPSKRI